MKAKHLYAQIFLGYHLLRHLARRIFRKRSPALSDFVEFYRDDKISFFSKQEKDLLSQWARCIGCGLCDSICQSVSPYPIGPSFLQKMIRSVPDFVGNAALDLSQCGRCGECETLCPTGVPIIQAIQFIQTQENEILHPATT